ncbi:MAG: DUF3828 domain-containing protein [Methyloceanibacter sp.]
MRFVLALVLAVAVGAAAPPEAADSDPVALIAAVYQTYLHDDVPAMTDIYSKRLQALIDKDARETPEGYVGRIDWDVFVDGQDWALSEFKIVPVAREGDKAQVRATFINMGEHKNMLFDLVREDGHWRIDEVAATLPPRYFMSKILADDPGAFPDAPQQ